MSESLTEGDRAILRSELGKLTGISQIARQWAIYDASVAAQTCAEGKWAIAEMELRRCRIRM